ncbi:hypothetical protein ACFX2J_034796 [Malus domestica]
MARAKENIYITTIGEELVARRLLEGNPWLVKGYFFSVKFWPISLLGSHYAGQARPKPSSGANEWHWHRKWHVDGVFYGIPDEEWEALTWQFQVNVMAK